MPVMSRRTFAVGLSSVVGAGLLGGRANGQPLGGEVRVISGFPAGTGGDTIIRFYATRMQPLLGAAIRFENLIETDRLEGDLATLRLLQAAPDGRTIYIAPSALLTANQVLAEHPKFDVAKSIRCFGAITNAPNTLVVAANSPYRDLAELTAAMTRKGAAARYGVPNGSIVRVIAGLYKQAAGLQAAEILRQRSVQVFEDLDAGAVDYAFSNNQYSVVQEQAGRIRILAVSLRARLKAAPQYATFDEYGYPAAIDGWWGGFVPAGTPRQTVERLGRALSTVVASEESRKFLNAIISDPLVQTPVQSQAHLLHELAAWPGYLQRARLGKLA